MNQLYDLVYRYQTYLLGVAICLVLCGVSFTFSGWSMDLIWRDRPLVALALVGFGLILVLLYIEVDKAKMKQLAQTIARSEADEAQSFQLALQHLTRRQMEVYQLIISGKSNKEITQELHIEPSTLKTHINQIYKKLQVANRRELRNKSI